MTSPPTVPTSAEPSFATRAEALVAPALAALERMVLPSGLCCYEVVDGDQRPRGESIRYSLIVLLGLLRAEQAGVGVPIATDRLRDAVDAALDRPEVTPGDVALRLWVEARTRGPGAEGLVAALERSLVASGGLPAREGLELAWIVTGLASTHDAGERGRRLLADALDQLIESNQAPSGLFRHYGDRSHRRRRFPNFATEIYSVHALSIAARRGLDERALSAARRGGDRLLALQLPDGGWPWLFDAERGTVVERYEVYSVHQHGMAPMGLHELAEASGDRRYADAAARGLPWMFGENELGVQMAPLERGMTFRSIRRRAPLDRLWLYANTATSSLVGRGGGSGRLLEVNPTCRPYELGWLVEAWAGSGAQRS
jgi:hypothetical protein